MTAGALAVDLLVGAAVLLTLASALGLAVMRDAYQRLHYIAPPATLSSALLTAALLLGEPQKQAGVKAFLVTALLTLMNGVVTHATARAARIRRHGRWIPVQEERVPLAKGEYAGPPLREGRKP
ncbi:MAG TPA: monovalent cation/H(+) antiporter subunit G [Longimicrobiales bacterium]